MLLCDVDTNRPRRVTYVDGAHVQDIGHCHITLGALKEELSEISSISGRVAPNDIDSKMVDNRVILQDDEQINDNIALTDGIKDIAAFTSTKNAQTSTGLAVSIG